VGLSASSPSLDLCRNSVLQILEKSLCAFFQNGPPDTVILQQQLLIPKITSDAQTKEPDHVWNHSYSMELQVFTNNKTKKRVWEDFVEMKFPHNI
jgi:hypothetical protein